MSTREDDVYVEINKQTPRYYTIFSNNKCNSSSNFNQKLV